MSIIEQMRKAMEKRLTLSNGVTLTIRRPTVLEGSELGSDSLRDAVISASKFVVDWEGVKTLDLWPGGDGTAAKFDREVFTLWLEDQPKYWVEIMNFISDSYTSHAKKLEEDSGN